MPLGRMLNDFNKLRWHRVMQYSDIKEAPLLMVLRSQKASKYGIRATILQLM